MLLVLGDTASGGSGKLPIIYKHIGSGKPIMGDEHLQPT